MRLRSYPKVWNLGHPHIEGLFNGPVYIQEKVDGSQFSFGVVDGELYMRSKGAAVYPETADKLFKPAVETALRLFEEGLLTEGWIYRGEALFRPKHNTLEYNRIPEGGFVLFDIDTGLERRLTPPDLVTEARKLGLELVPLLDAGVIKEGKQLEEYLELESYLGGPKVEGVVIKNYAQHSPKDGKMLMGKLVSPDFREKHKRTWKAGKNPVDSIIDSLRTEARWEKSIQHRRDRGELLNAPQDIGPLLKEIKQDVLEEEEEYIKEKLFEAYSKQILRGVTGGFPQWYKERLYKQSLESVDDA